MYQNIISSIFASKVSINVVRHSTKFYNYFFILRVLTSAVLLFLALVHDTSKYKHCFISYINHHISVKISISIVIPKSWSYKCYFGSYLLSLMGCNSQYVFNYMYTHFRIQGQGLIHSKELALIHVIRLHWEVIDTRINIPCFH